METAGSDFPWRQLPLDSTDTCGAVVYSRPLTGMERMYALIERSMPGHNQPFLGAHISVSPSTQSSSESVYTESTPSGSAPGITLSMLRALARNSWMRTRYQYPMVACQLQLEDRGPGTQTMSYKVENDESVRRWVDRTFMVVVAEGGWTALREKLSVEFDLPSDRDGDCCFFYIVVNPAQLASDLDSVHSFDILLHIHHALTDGPGLKTVLHSILSSFSASFSSEAHKELLWGEEAKRGLMPAQVDIATDDELAGVQKDVDEKAVMNMMAGLVFVSSAILPLNIRCSSSSSQRTDYKLKTSLQPDIGLPLYRPSILNASRSTRGSAVISHTFTSPSFLPSLLSLSRSHGMTITHLIAAALAVVVHSINVAASASEVIQGLRPSPTEKYVYAPAVDPRNGRIRAPYCDPNVYVFNTTGVHIFDIPVSLFDEGQDQYGCVYENERDENVVFWRVARRVKESYDDLKTKKGLIGNGHLWLSKFVEMAKKQGYVAVLNLFILFIYI